MTPRASKANYGDTLRAEYPDDLIKSGVLGKYAKQFCEGITIVLIAPDYGQQIETQEKNSIRPS